MAKSIRPFVLDRLTQLEPKRGCVSSALYTGRDLVQMTRFEVIREPWDEDGSSGQIQGTASDSHFVFRVDFDLDAVKRIEQRSGERTTSHLRCILALLSYRIELVPPYVAHPGHETSNKPTIRFRALDWAYVIGSRDEGVYHPKARDLEIGYQPNMSAGYGHLASLPLIDLRHLNMRPEEQATWLAKREKASLAIGAWLIKIRNDPVEPGWEVAYEAEQARIAEQKRKEIEVNSSDEGFARRLPVVKLENMDSSPLLDPALRKLLRPSPEPMSIVRALVESYLSGESIDHAFHIPRSDPEETNRSLLARETRMRSDLRALRNYKTMRPDDKGKTVEMFWDWEQADRSRREGWIEEWVQYEPVPVDEEGGAKRVFGSSGKTESIGGNSHTGDESPTPAGPSRSHPLSEEAMLPNEGDVRSLIASPVSSAGEIAIPWERSPTPSGTRLSKQGIRASHSKPLGSRPLPPVTSSSAGGARMRYHSSVGAARDGKHAASQPWICSSRKGGLAGHVNEDSDELASDGEDEEDSSLEIRPQATSARSLIPRMTQSRPIVFQGVASTSPLSERSRRSPSALDARECHGGPVMSETDPEDDHAMLDESMVFTQAYVRNQERTFDIGSSLRERQSASKRQPVYPSWKRTTSLEKHVDGAPEASQPIETATSDEVLKESLEQDTTEIFFRVRQASIEHLMTQADPMIMSIPQEDEDEDRESLNQRVLPYSQGRSSVLVDESDEEEKHSRPRIVGRTPRGAKAKARPETAASRSKLHADPGLSGSDSKRGAGVAIKVTSRSPPRFELGRKRRVVEQEIGTTSAVLPVLDLTKAKRPRKSLEGTSKFTPILLQARSFSVSGGGPSKPPVEPHAEPQRSASTEKHVTRRARWSGHRTEKLELKSDMGLTLDELLD